MYKQAPSGRGRNERPWTATRRGTDLEAAVRGIYGISGWWQQGDWTSTSERVSSWNDIINADDGLVVPYVDANHASAPDHATYTNATMSIIVLASLTNWGSTASNQILVSHRTSSTSNVGWAFSTWTTSGRLRFVMSTDGSTVLAVNSSLANPIIASGGGYIWLMVTYDGGSGDVIFYHAAYAGSTVLPGAWTQLGTTQNTGGGAPFNSTARLVVGGQHGGVATTEGVFKRAVVYSGVVASDGTGGAVVFDADFAAQPDGTTSFTEASATAATVTVNSTAGPNPCRIDSPIPLAQGTGANQPIELPWTGENYAWFGGTGSHRITTPDKAGYNISTLSVAALVAMDDWVGTANAIMSQRTSAVADFAWYVGVAATGTLTFNYTADGTTPVNNPSTANPTVSDFGYLWVLMTYDGVSGDLKFYTAAATAGASLPTAWSQLGATVAAGAATLFNSTATLTVGNHANGGIPATGKIKRAVFFSGIVASDGTGGTVLADMNATQQAEGATSWADSESNTWTVSSSAGAKTCQIVGSQQIMGDQAATYMRVAYTRPQALTRFFLFQPRNWTIGNYAADGVGANTAAIVATTSTPRYSQNAGGGAANEVTGTTVGTYHVLCTVWDGASSQFIVDGTVTSGGNPGAATTGGLTILADGQAVAANWCAGQFKEVIEFNRTLSTTEIATVTNYLAAKGRLGFTV